MTQAKVALISLFVLLAGCAGYRVGSTKPAAFANIESIAVPTFKNDTLEPRSAVLLTNSVIRRFHEDGTYRITTVDKADAILEGTFTRVERRQLRAARNDQLRTRELEVVIFVDYVLRDPATDAVLADGTVRGDTDIFLDPNFQLSERQAFPVAADDLAGELVSELSEGW